MGAQLHEDRVGVISFTYNPAEIAAATTAEQTVTVKGLKTTDMVLVKKPTLTAGVGIVNARVSAADTLAVTWVNATAAPVDPASETYHVFVFRAERITTEFYP
jgi:hypothetical protein